MCFQFSKYVMLNLLRYLCSFLRKLLSKLLFCWESLNMIMFDANTTKTYMLEMFIPLLQYFYMTTEHINLLFEVWEIIPRLKAWSASTRLHSTNSVLSRHSVSVCRQGWPQTFRLPTNASQTLGIQARVTKFKMI